MIQVIPFIFILQLPIYIQLIYFVFALWLAVLGNKRKGGFWCYLFASVLLSPVVGMMMLLVAEKKA